MVDQSKTLLRVQNLQVAFNTEGGRVKAVDGVSFSVDRGKTLAIVGESGCGKSVTAMSIMGLIQESNGFIEAGEILFEGQDLTKISKEKMRGLRGHRISMIFQEPMTALNPVYSVGDQIAEVLRIHRHMPTKEAKQEVLRILKLVQIADPEQCMDQYPFQLSGGMRQRMVIAMALACEPGLLIADEPTTALDVTIQAQILRLMKDLQQKKNTAIVFITHDLGVVAEMADYVLIMYAGQAVEYGLVLDIFERPEHPYTKGLLKSRPSLTQNKSQKLHTIEGSVPSLRNLQPGCRFNSRCAFAHDLCLSETPKMHTAENGHQVACHLAGVYPHG